VTIRKAGLEQKEVLSHTRCDSSVEFTATVMEAKTVLLTEKIGGVHEEKFFK